MRTPGRRGGAGWLAISLVLAASVAAAVVLALDHQRDFRDRQQQEAERVARALNFASAATAAQLESLGKLAEREPGSEPHSFAELTRPLTRVHLAESFIFLDGRGPSEGDRAAGIPAPGQRHYVPRHTTGTGPLDRIRPADAESARHLLEALDAARNSGLPAASRATRIHRAPGHHILIARPVGATGPAGPGDPGDPAPGPWQVFVAAIVPVQALLDTVELTVPSGTAAHFVGEEGAVLPEGAPDGEGSGSSTVVIADRELELHLRAPGSASILVPMLIGLGGLLVALAMAALLLTWSRRERAALEMARQRVAERDRALRAEAATNRMYRFLAENLTDLVMVSDPEGRITYASPAARSMLGWEPEELKGRPLFDLIHPDDLAAEREILDEVMASPAVKTFEHRLMRSSGEFMWVETAVRSVEDPETDEVGELQSTSRDISERKPLQEQLERLAREDPLTGLANRRLFRETLAAEAARSGRGSGELALMMIDVDHFKSINDDHGHLVGDRVMQLVSGRIRRRLRASDTIARLGGDEFAAVLPETNESEALLVAQGVAESVREDSGSDEVPEVTVSIGVAAGAGGGPIDPEVLLERADEALYEAKRAGRNGIRAFGAEADSSSRA